MHAAVDDSRSTRTAVHRHPLKQHHLVATSWRTSPDPDGAGKGHPSLSPLPNGPTEGGGATANGPVPRRGEALAGSHDVLVCGVDGNWCPSPRLGGGMPAAATGKNESSWSRDELLGRACGPGWGGRGWGYSIICQRKKVHTFKSHF
jgi:hypothetical protein